MPFTAKQLRITFVLSGASKFSNSSNTLVVTGLRAACVIQSMQFPAFPEADIRVYGLLEADMNTLTCFEQQWSVTGNALLNTSRNTVIVEANGGAGWVTVFSGQMISAQPTYENAPDVALQIKARVLFYESLATTAPTSYTGSTDVATVVSNLASRIGATFENNGVKATLSNPYWPGTIGDQLQAVAEHAHIGLFYDYGPAGASSPTTICIAPKGVPRKTPVVALAPGAQLVGWPTLDSLGWIFCRSEFNPALKFGGTVKISNSTPPRSNGTWFVLQLTHAIDALVPGGGWFSDMHLSAIFPYAQ